MSTAIQVTHLAKRYWLNHSARARPGTLREELAERLRAPARALGLRFKKNGHVEDATKEEFWALRDVTFGVERGEVVGIVGRNGAGKSTLLKILSRITEPTAGRVAIDGRVASLLEVGTGFHSELTGRENIFLNGAILGMTRAEIRHKFDEIVAFAEVEKFLDTPVKRYSSGMYVRLAFAVAAHLDPEILIVDEVLAVGDTQFQKKCLGKMKDVSSNEGRTVLFVSHQLGTVRQLCGRAILLRAGCVAAEGKTADVLQTYMSEQLGPQRAVFLRPSAMRHKDMALQSAWTANDRNQIASHFLHTEAIDIRIHIRVNKWITGAEVRLVVGDSRGRRVFTSDADLQHAAGGGAGAVQACARISAHFLRPETYTVAMALFVNNQLIIDLIEDAFSFSVQDAGSKYAASEGLDYGCVFAPCDWNVVHATDDQWRQLPPEVLAENSSPRGGEDQPAHQMTSEKPCSVARK